MFEAPAIVVRTEAEVAWVHPTAGRCAVCASGKGCGLGRVSRCFSARPAPVLVHNRARARDGDAVVIGIPERLALVSICRVYMLPPLGLIAGGAAGRALAPGAGGELVSAALGFLGLTVALWLAARERRDSVRNLVPAIMRILPVDDKQSEQN